MIATRYRRPPVSRPGVRAPFRFRPYWRSPFDVRTAVLVDDTTFSGPGTPGVLTDSFGGAGVAHGFDLDIGSGPNGTTNRVLIIAVIGIGASSGTSSAMSATWDSLGTPQAMTLIGTSSDAVGDLWLFGLLSPTLGAKTLTLSWTGANQFGVAGASYVGATQTSIAAAFPNFTKANGSGGTNSLPITNASGDVAFAGHVTNGNYTSGNATDIGHSNTGNVNSDAANYSSSTNPTLTYSSSGSAWSSVGCSVSAGGAAATTFTKLVGAGGLAGVGGSIVGPGGLAG